MSPLMPKKQGINADRLKLELRRAIAPFILLVLLAVGGLFAAIDLVGNLSGQNIFKSYTHYQVAFADVKGVTPGRVPVRVAGVPAGAVTGSQLVHGQAVLDIALEKQYAPLYKNAVMRLRPITALEDYYLDITSRGTPSAGIPPKGYIIPASQTTSPVTVSSVLDTFDSVTRQRLTTMLDELGSGLGTTGGAELRESFTQLAPFLSAANHFSIAVDDQHAALQRLVHNFGGIMQTLALRDHQLSSFVLSTDRTLGALAQNDGPFSATLQALPPLLSSLKSSLATVETSENHIDPALTSLEPVAKSLPSGLDALSTFSTEATPALRAADPAVRALVPFATALRPTANTLQQNVNLLQTQAPQLDRITKPIVPCEYLTDHFLNNLAALAAWSDDQDGNEFNALARASVNVSVSSGDDQSELGEHIEKPCYEPGGFTGP
jgi:ABC-type transporter Mla subunit MlaD